MAADNAAKLYTPDILALAIELANFPITDNHALRAEARSRSCGSSLSVGLNATSGAAISSIGIQVSACAIGQASAAIFVRSAIGKSAAELDHALTALEGWLGDSSNAPAWRNIDQLGAARAYPARHEAILLPWRAATAALSKADTQR